jgi:hypothetical protein
LENYSTGVRPMLRLTIKNTKYQVIDYIPKTGNLLTDNFKFFACGSTVGPNVDILRTPFTFRQPGTSPRYTILWNQIERYQIANTPIASNKCEDLVGIGHTHFYVALRKDLGSRSTIVIYEFNIDTDHILATLTKWSTITNLDLKARF